MSAATDFRLYYGNALDVLAELLAHELRESPAGANLLDPDTILIPQPAMRRWLQKTLAERHGIAANLRFLTPGEFVGEMLAANVDGEDAPTLDPSRLVWRLYATLRDPSARTHPAIATSLARFLDGSASELKAWSLANALAEVFAKYQAWRRDWLLAWDRGADRDDWQAELWRRATRGLTHRAHAIDRFLAQQDVENAPAPRGTPARLFAFGCINVSPDVLRIIAAASRACTVHFYLPTPTRKYWGDLRTLRERLADTDADPLDTPENPLLAAWGRAGRDFIATLFSYELVTPREIEFYAEPEPSGMLQRLQRDLLDRRAPAALRIPLDAIAADRTLQIHACHTRLREVEVLHDQLRALIEADPALEPRDIAVMAPDIDAYVPLIAAVFGGALGTTRFIPYTVADESALASAPVAALVLRLLDLSHARLTSNDVLDLLALPPVARRFDLDAEALDRLRRWIDEAGARWGLDAAHRARLGAPADDAFTWRFALDRLLLGHAAGDESDIAGVAPWPGLEGTALDALDALVEVLRVLDRALHESTRSQSAADWQALLARSLDALLPINASDGAEQRARDRVFAEIDAFRRAIDDANVRDALPADVVRAHFAARFAETDARQPFLAGGVTFCRMVPMRLIPFRVIALLGLNDRDFPRQEPASVLNRLAAALDRPGQRRRGDRSVRDDDRFLFLQLLAAADRTFYLSFVGRDAMDGTAREPSSVVSELLDVASRYFDDPAEARRRLVVQHALQPFGKALDDDPRRIRFDSTWRDALRTAPGANAAAPFVPAALAADATLIARTIDYATLRRFFIDAPKIFLRERLRVRIDEDEAHLPDAEPFVAADGLEHHIVHRRVFDALLDDTIDEVALCTRLQAEALLAPGAAGAERLRAIASIAGPVAEAVRGARSGEPRRLPFSIAFGDVTLAGALDDVDDAHALRTKIGTPSGRDQVRWHLDALVLAALGDPRRVLTFACFAENDFAPRPLASHPQHDAQAALRWLVDRFVGGLQAPLPFRPSTAWTWYETERERGDVGAADYAAAQAWSNRNGGGEGTDAATQLALRGAMPFEDATATAQFRAATRAIFDALLHARVPEPPR